MGDARTTKSFELGEIIDELVGNGVTLEQGRQEFEKQFVKAYERKKASSAELRSKGLSKGLRTEMTDAPRLSIHEAKTHFSKIVKEAQEGGVRIVENRRDKGEDPVMVISVKQLHSLLVRPETKLAELFPVSPNNAAKRLVFDPSPREAAPVRLSGTE